MREVRMTFGEHLEELRWRIIVSLMWLTLGVTISFVFGRQLMDVALGPHDAAFRRAQRDRLIQRMERILEDLTPLMRMDPSQAKFDGNRLIEAGETIRWEALFVGSIARAVLDGKQEGLTDPWRKLAAAIRENLVDLPEARGERLAEAFVEAGSEHSHQLLEDLLPALEIVGHQDIPRRFTHLAQSIRELQAGEGGERVKRLLGWGKSFDKVLELLDRFQSFFARRQESLEALARAGGIELTQLQESVENSRLSEGFGRALGKLEESFSEITSQAPRKIMVLSYLESFSNYLKVALIFGLMITIPFILYEMWKFVGAGLHLHEQKYVVTFLPFSLALFVVGMLFGYFAMIPVGLEFLAGWASEETIEYNFTLGNYIGLFFTLTLILGLVFQTPLVMIFLAKLGVVEVMTFRRHRRISIFIGLCLAVVLTPPDPFSWSLMMLPMWGLYELGIVICSWLTRKREEVAT